MHRTSRDGWFGSSGGGSSGEDLGLPVLVHLGLTQVALFQISGVIQPRAEPINVNTNIRYEYGMIIGVTHRTTLFRVTFN